MTHAKAAVAVIGTVISVVVASFSGDNTISPQEWINVAISAATALAVYTAPNVPGAHVTKFLLAILMAMLTLAVTLIAGGVTTAEWLQIAMAGLAAVGVYAMSNSDDVPATPPPVGV
jgi:hypothetical protein